MKTPFKSFHGAFNGPNVKNNMISQNCYWFLTGRMSGSSRLLCLNLEDKMLVSQLMRSTQSTGVVNLVIMTLRKQLWTWRQTTSSWCQPKRPCTFTLTMPSKLISSSYLLTSKMKLNSINLKNNLSFPIRSGRTYSYLFTEPSRMPVFPLWMGADHAEDLQYVFGKPLSTPLGYFPRHRDVARYMISYWTNFAQTGYINITMLYNTTVLKHFTLFH